MLIASLTVQNTGPASLARAYPRDDGRMALSLFDVRDIFGPTQFLI
jgi:hypothetical protein